MHELPSIFYHTYKDHLKERMLFVDLNDNQIELHLGKGKTSGYILFGLENLLKFYSLKKGGWLKLIYVGEDVFFLQKVKDNNMCKMIVDHPTGDLNTKSVADILQDIPHSLPQNTNPAYSYTHISPIILTLHSNTNGSFPTQKVDLGASFSAFTQYNVHNQLMTTNPNANNSYQFQHNEDSFRYGSVNNNVNNSTDYPLHVLYGNALDFNFGSFKNGTTSNIDLGSSTPLKSGYVRRAKTLDFNTIDTCYLINNAFWCIKQVSYNQIQNSAVVSLYLFRVYIFFPKLVQNLVVTFFLTGFAHQIRIECFSKQA
ncbi:hypothetical protein HN51_035741 [Arachis hypogaea]